MNNGENRLIDNRYRFGRVIANTNFTILNYAVDTRLGDLPVVVKQLKREHAGNPAVLEMFLGEANRFTKFNHANIVTVRDVIQEGGDYCTVFEYMDGRDLGELIEHMRTGFGTGLSPELAVHIVTQVCFALEYAHHEHGLVHGDVTPSNVLFSRQGDVKLTDFGIARARDQLAEDVKAGVVKGTYPYMSPEQVQGKMLDPTSDIYSLGIVLYEALTGEKLFEAENDTQLLLRIARGGIDRSRLNSPAIPKPLRPILSGALHPNPKKRFQRAVDMARALAGFMRDYPDVQQWLASFIRTTYPAAADGRDAVTEVRAPVKGGDGEPTAVGDDRADLEEGGVVAGTADSLPPTPTTPAKQPPRTIIDIIRVTAYSGRRFFAIGGAVAAGILLVLLALDVIYRVTPIGKTVYFRLFPPVATIDSYPRRAEVIVDGQHVGITPLRLARVRPGDRNVELRLDGYEPVQNVMPVPEGRGKRVECTYRFSVPVDFVTQPPGAEVTWSGERIGVTPCFDYRAEMGPDPSVFKLECGGFNPLTRQVDLNAERDYRERFLNVAMARGAGSLKHWQVNGTFYGFVDIRVGPADATVLMDDSVVVTNGGRAMVTVPYGKHRLEASRTGYQPGSRPVEITRGDTAPGSLFLTKLVNFSVTDKVSGGDVEGVRVRANGRWYDKTRSIPLADGPHNAMVTAPDYDTALVSVEVGPNSRATWSVALARAPIRTTVFVEDQAGNPQSSVTVRAYSRQGGDPITVGTTNGSGFVVTTALEGVYNFETRPFAGDWEHHKQEHNIRWGLPNQITLRCDGQ